MNPCELTIDIVAVAALHTISFGGAFHVGTPKLSIIYTPVFANYPSLISVHCVSTGKTMSGGAMYSQYTCSVKVGTWNSFIEYANFMFSTRFGVKPTCVIWSVVKS